MPIRFQVDADFYDHPKSIGMTDAATALWVRAGSYSAAKLLDGFIAEHVLATLSRSPEDASAELVARGLWRRVRGGFRFHQWEQRNLVKEQIEADREYWREKKRQQRLEASGPKKPQAGGTTVPKGQPVDSMETLPGVPATSVSVSESISASASASLSEPLSERLSGAAKSIFERTTASPAEAEAIAAAIARDRRPRSLAGFVRALAVDELDAMLADLRRNADGSEVAALIAAARQGPPCRHGDPGGANPHPVSGEPLCPKCRRAARTQPPEGAA